MQGKNVAFQFWRISNKDFKRLRRSWTKKQITTSFFASYSNMQLRKIKEHCLRHLWQTQDNLSWDEWNKSTGNHQLMTFLARERRAIQMPNRRHIIPPFHHCAVYVYPQSKQDLPHLQSRIKEGCQEAGLVGSHLQCASKGVGTFKHWGKCCFRCYTHLIWEQINT